MMDERDLWRNESSDEPLFELRFNIDELISTDVQLSAGVAVAQMYARGSSPQFRGIEELNAGALQDLHLHVRNALLSLGRKKYARLEVTESQLVAYGRSIPVVATAGDYIKSIGRAESALFPSGSRQIAVGMFKSFNDAFVKAGGNSNLRLLNELDAWVSSADLT